MNPSNPTHQEMKDIEALFFHQMRHQTRLATDPILRARAQSFDFQFSDRWFPEALLLEPRERSSRWVVRA